MPLKLVRGIERNSKKSHPNFRTLCRQLNSETGTHAVRSTHPVSILFIEWKWSNLCMEECGNYSEERRKERRVKVY